jgi:hypothetical protein
MLRRVEVLVVRWQLQPQQVEIMLTIPGMLMALEAGLLVLALEGLRAPWAAHVSRAAQVGAVLLVVLQERAELA